MKGMNSLPLDDDILDRVLTFLPDFGTLHSTILSNKAFYGVFQSHPNSITRSVAYNVVGPPLPQALRVLRFRHPQPDEDLDNPPWRETDPVSPITPAEAQDLITNAAVVNELEAIFSSRHKDKTSQQSKLTSMESWRFRRAVYRLMLYSTAFPIDDSSLEDHDEFDDEILQGIHRERRNLLSEFDTIELREVHSVSLFFVELSEWIRIAANGESMDQIALCAGPKALLEAYHDADPSDMLEDFYAPDDAANDHPLLSDYISGPLRSIWEMRKVKPPADDNTHWKSILDSNDGENDICANCSLNGGFDLWNEHNWERLRGEPNNTMYQIGNRLKGKLAANIFEPHLLRDELNQGNFTYTTLMSELFDVKTAKHQNWNKSDWFCGTCITTFMADHLHLWLLARKRARPGAVIPADCWYGYNCRTQTHKRLHAQEKNHLCEPRPEYAGSA